MNSSRPCEDGPEVDHPSCAIQSPLLSASMLGTMLSAGRPLPIIRPGDSGPPDPGAVAGARDRSQTNSARVERAAWAALPSPLSPTGATTAGGGGEAGGDPRARVAAEPPEPAGTSVASPLECWLAWSGCTTMRPGGGSGRGRSWPEPGTWWAGPSPRLSGRPPPASRCGRLARSWSGWQVSPLGKPSHGLLSQPLTAPRYPCP